MIDVHVVSKFFGDLPVLRAIDFSMTDGETLAILGPSGVGKSTLLRLVAGIDPAFEGEIARPERIAMVFQEPVLLAWRTALQNITLVHPELSQQAACDMLRRVGIADKADVFPGQMSLGQQRRLALARAFAGSPQLLVLDEPFVSLDPQTAEDMLVLTERLIAEKRPTTLLVTHSEAEARRLATRILRLEGKPATLTTEPRLVPPRSEVRA